MDRKLKICIVLISLLLCVGFYLMPAISDDLGYAMPFRDYILGDANFDWSKIWESIVFRYSIDNARLSNIVAILLSPLPRIFGVFGSFISLTYLFFCGAKYAKIKCNSLLMALWMAYIVFAFPWVDQMYLIDFQINYLWSTALTLMLSFMLLKQRKYKLWQVAIMSLILGLWHEGFAFPMTVAIAALYLMYKRMRTAKTATMFCTLVVGQLYLFTAPCFGGDPCRYFETRQIMYLPYLIPNIVAIGYILFKRIKLSVRTLVLVIPAIVSAVIMVYTQVGSRAGTLSVAYSGLCLLMLINKISDKKVFASAIFVITTLHLAAVDVQAYQANIETKRVLQEWKKCPENVIFSDMILRENVPWYCLQKPYYGWLSHNSTLRVFEIFYGETNHQLKVAPNALKDFSIAEADRIEGTAEAYLYKGLIVRPMSLTNRCVCLCEIDYGVGAKDIYPNIRNTII